MSLPPFTNPPRAAHFSDQPDEIIRPLTPAEELYEEPDIYRGEPPVERPPSPLRPPSVSSSASSSSSSSSSSSGGRGRWRGSTLATLVEHAISRWGRRSSSSSDSSSSRSGSTSSSSSSGSHSHATRKRRKRRNSMSSQSKLHFDPEAYAARKKAREDAKLESREFVLYLPSSLTPNGNAGNGKQKSAPMQSQAAQQRVLRTTSQKLIIAQLDFALKRASKLRRPPRLRTQNLDGPASTPASGASTPLGSFQDLQKLRKPKTKDHPPDDTVEAAQRAWWLDVSSPTWADMRAIGKLLHLHPLTLEDIVQREPREKLELFPKLGYYFVSFRAMESERSRAQATGRRSSDSDSDETLFQDTDVVQGVNMYLVVFREGICSFHFEDMSDHTDRVRKKLLDFQSTLVMSSDFVCHGLIDSIVDSFYPVFHNIEREVEALDSLIISIGANTDRELQRDRGMGDVTDLLRVVQGGAAIELAAAEHQKAPSSPTTITAAEKDGEKRSPKMLTFSIVEPKAVAKPMIARFRDAVARADRRVGWLLPFRHRRVEPKQTMVTLLRMTNTRRLVTQLGRLLAAKSEVVAQLQKRLLHVSGTGGELDWGGNGANGEITAYMGDVQDHIIFLQQSLAHYERILGHSHPAYLSHLRISFSQARGGVDKAIVGLTTVSMMVLCMQGLLGVFSMNVKVPQNNLDGHDYIVFACVLSAACLIGIGVVSMVRLWWIRAKKRYARRSI